MVLKHPKHIETTLFPRDGCTTAIQLLQFILTQERILSHEFKSMVPSHSANVYRVGLLERLRIM